MKKTENVQMPDFKQLDDRFIAEAPSEPMLVIKTKLDPKNSTEKNPYYQSHGVKDVEKFRNYFEERE
ncbi:hypothetical protein [Bacillus sp. B15-48]|uniref:hypothetical protein n=1 Tax=Bacillus sp. B15-48 TaxID=1548601 RepID=UPI00193EC409|nr:hypothetical protein [Bacillus sp. B15-48]MBM4761938.1 hypothetical protein [Bacillus sp. B15-48]